MPRKIIKDEEDRTYLVNPYSDTKVEIVGAGGGGGVTPQQVQTMIDTSLAPITTAINGKENELVAGTNITLDKDTLPGQTLISASGGGGGGPTSTTFDFTNNSLILPTTSRKVWHATFAGNLGMSMNTIAFDGPNGYYDVMFNDPNTQGEGFGRIDMTLAITSQGFLMISYTRVCRQDGAGEATSIHTGNGYLLNEDFDPVNVLVGGGQLVLQYMTYLSDKKDGPLKFGTEGTLATIEEFDAVSE